MNYRKLGKTDLRVSDIGFGCWAIGGHSYGEVNDEESLLALHTAYEKGVNFFDTADSYGNGHSEEILATFIKGHPRERMIIATKCGHDFYQGAIRKNFASKYIRFACEESLKRLEIDTIDLYQLHNPSLEILEQGEAIQTLEALRLEGKIRYIGVSLHGTDTALRCLEDARVDALQVLFNLIDQRMSFRIFPLAAEKKKGIIVREPLANGLLTGKYQVDSQFPKNDHRHGWTLEKRQEDFAKLQKIQTILATKRFSLARASLEYALAFESVSTVIPGAKTASQVLENILASTEPQLRSQEASLLRDLYMRDPLFPKKD